MKKIVAILMCILLAASACMAAADGEYANLAEKFTQQLRTGSSVRGLVALRVTGGSAWAQMLAPVSNVKLQMMLAEDNATGAYHYQFYVNDANKQPYGVTHFYGDRERMYLKSDLLLDSLFSMPVHGDLVSSLTGVGQGNPTWYSALQNILSIREKDWADNWEPVLAPYYLQIEQWMAPYAAEPKVVAGDNGTVMGICYVIPPKAVKAEMKALLRQALGDELLMRLVRVQLTDEQNTVYLNSGLLWYYDTLIDALPLEGDIVLEHEVTARGERLYTGMTFPVAGVEGLNEVRLEQEEGVTRIILTGEAGQLLLAVGEAREGVTEGTLSLSPAEGKPVDAAFTLRKEVSTYTDDETNTHEVTAWNLTVEKIEALPAAMDFAPIAAKLQVHYYSKPLKNQSTTLEISGSFAQGNDSLAFSSKFATVQMEVDLDDLPRTGAKDLAAMTDEARSEVLTDLLLNALIVYGQTGQEVAQ